jgi:hypothetical protein
VHRLAWPGQPEETAALEDAAGGDDDLAALVRADLAQVLLAAGAGEEELDVRPAQAGRVVPPVGPRPQALGEQVQVKDLRPQVLSGSLAPALRRGVPDPALGGLPQPRCEIPPKSMKPLIPSAAMSQRSLAYSDSGVIRARLTAAIMVVSGPRVSRSTPAPEAWSADRASSEGTHSARSQDEVAEVAVRQRQALHNVLVISLHDQAVGGHPALAHRLRPRPVSVQPPHDMHVGTLHRASQRGRVGHEVHVRTAQPRCLAAPQPGTGQQHHDEPVTRAPARAQQREHLLIGGPVTPPPGHADTMLCPKPVSHRPARAAGLQRQVTDVADLIQQRQQVRRRSPGLRRMA